MENNILQHNVSLLPYNTFNIHSIARDFIIVKDESSFGLLQDIYKTKKLFILGGGSNTVFVNKVTESTVAKIENKGICIIREDEDNIIIECAAGEVWKDFVLWCCKNNYCGLENLAAIYGSVGACPVQNIGAYGQEVKNVISQVIVYDLEKGSFCNIEAKDCRFGYRNSVFKYQKGNMLIWKVRFKLKKHFVFNDSYHAVAAAFGDTDKKLITASMVADKVTQIRNSKLPNPKELGNVGSFFKNPVISTDHYNDLKEKYPDIVAFDDDKGKKISAGWLIEKCGWKGKRINNAGMHAKQSLVLVNYGVDDAEEIIDFAKTVAGDIKKTFGIDLIQEPHIVL